MNKKEKLETATLKVLDIMKKMVSEDMEKMPQEVIEKADPLMLISTLVMSLEMRMFGPQGVSRPAPTDQETPKANNKGFFDFPKETAPKAPVDIKKDYKNYN